MKIENKKRNDNQTMLSSLAPGTPFVFVRKNDFDNLAIVTDEHQYVYLNTGNAFDIKANDDFVIPVNNAKIVFD